MDDLYHKMRDTSFTDLPEELRDGVVAELADDVKTLKSCSLVSHSFHATAYRYILSDIQLVSRHTDEPSDCERFHRLLCDSPEVALLVRSLVIVVSKRHSCILYDNRLSSVLDRLYKLEKFAIISATLFHRVYWSRLPEPLQISLRDVFCLPQMRTIAIDGVLHFDGMEQLMDLLKPCRGLRDLTLSPTSIAQDRTRGPPSQAEATVATLFRLDVRHVAVARIIDWIMSHMKVHRLKELVLTNVLPGKDFAAAQRLLDSSGGSLLNVSISGRLLDSSTLDFRPLKILRKIILVLDWDPSYSSLDAIQWVTATLDTILHPSSVARIAIACHIEGESDDCIPKIQAWKWSQFNILLKRFTSLRTVDLMVTFEDDFKGLSGDRLRSLTGNNIVHFRAFDRISF